MLVDLQRAVGNYLHDVFVVKLDWWIVLGFVAQALFTMRFLVQWIASERAGRSVVPMAFWVFSIGGGVLLFVYALYRRDPVFILGQGLGVFIYLRNLYFVLREKRRAVGAAVTARRRRIAAKPRSRSAVRSPTSSSPMWKRTPGRPGSMSVAVRKAAQSNGIARLSKPPQDAPMPNSVSALMKACAAASGIGLSTMLNSPDAPEKSRFQIAWPGSVSSAGCSTRATSGRAASQRATASADC